MKKIVATVIVVLVLIATMACGGKGKSKLLPGQLEPGTTEFILNEGLFHLNNGNIDQAEKKFLQVIKKKPAETAALNGLGIVYTFKKEFDKAIEVFKKALKYDPKFIDIHNTLGIIYTEMDKYDLAKENLLIAANSDDYRTPENAFVNLAKLEIKHKKYESALRYVEKGIRNNRTFSPLYNMKGLILENQKDYKKAVENYEKALSLLTDEDTAVLINLGRAYARMGNKSKALDTLERALSKALNDNEKAVIRALIKEVEKQ